MDDANVPVSDCLYILCSAPLTGEASRCCHSRTLGSWTKTTLHMLRPVNCSFPARTHTSHKARHSVGLGKLGCPIGVLEAEAFKQRSTR